MLTEFVKVASVSDFPEGDMLGVTAEGEEICLAQIGGEFFAINNICSHFFTWLSSGEIHADDYVVQCPLHDSRFSFKTGDPHQPPADKPVDVYSIRIDGDDILVGPKEEE